jgi:hypothetical protein
MPEPAAVAFVSINFTAAAQFSMADIVLGNLDDSLKDKVRQRVG